MGQPQQEQQQQQQQQQQQLMQGQGQGRQIMSTSSAQPGQQSAYYSQGSIAGTGMQQQYSPPQQQQQRQQGGGGSWAPTATGPTSATQAATMQSYARPAAQQAPLGSRTPPTTGR